MSAALLSNFSGPVIDTVLHFFWSRPITNPTLTDVLAGFWFAGFLLFTKAVAQTLLEPHLKKWLKRRNNQYEEHSADVFEELWITCGGAVLVSCSTYLVASGSLQCSLWNTDGCLAGWPNHQMSRSFRAFYLILFGWYTHDILGLPLGMKPKLTADLIAHHLLTIVLIIVSYMANLTRIGMLTMSLFDVSNPFLHVAKIAHILKLDTMKAVTFPLFAAVFFFARVLMVPFTILKCTIFQGRLIVGVPSWLFYGGNGLLLLLYGMQLLWFHRIVKIVAAAVPS